MFIKSNVLNSKLFNYSSKHLILRHLSLNKPIITDPIPPAISECQPSLKLQSSPPKILNKTPTLTRDILKLTKLNLSILNGIAASMTFGMILPFDIINNLGIFVGTTLFAMSSQSLNQVIETKYDALMNRTKNRPLPTGRITANQAMVGSAAILSTGALILANISVPATLIGVTTLLLYVGPYTELKRKSSANTTFGAIVGSLPPLLGFAATLPALHSFSFIHMLSMPALLYLWQFPHFYGLAWKYQDEYRNAGFKMISGEDPSGKKTIRVMNGCVAGIGIWSIAMGIEFTSWMIVPVGTLCMVWFGKTVRLFAKATDDKQRQKAGIYIFKVSNYVLLILLGAIFMFSHNPHTRTDVLSTSWRDLLISIFPNLEINWRSLLNNWVNIRNQILLLGNEFCIHTQLITKSKMCPVKLLESATGKNVETNTNNNSTKKL